MFNLSEEELSAMADVDVRAVNIQELTDIRDIKIDAGLSVEEKRNALAEQAGNPYLYRYGDYVVKLAFQKEGPTIDDKLEEYLKRLTRPCFDSGVIYSGGKEE